ncbi:MAG TPA: hypothetical protein VFC16_15805 [Nakamurella sp.]|nr:hypothetical protein [Nakamurella sp.]
MTGPVGGGGQDVEHGDDVRAGQRGRGPGLAQGAFPEPRRLGGHAARQVDLLHDDPAAQQLIGGRP